MRHTLGAAIDYSSGKNSSHLNVPPLKGSRGVSNGHIKITGIDCSHLVLLWCQELVQPASDGFPRQPLGHPSHPVGSQAGSLVSSPCMGACTLSRFSRVRLCVTPWAVARQAPLSVGSSRQEHWSGLPCPPPGDLPDSGMESGSPVLQVNSLPPNRWGGPSSPCRPYNAAFTKCKPTASHLGDLSVRLPSSAFIWAFLPLPFFCPYSAPFEFHCYLFLLSLDLCFGKELRFVSFHAFKAYAAPVLSAVPHGPVHSPPCWMLQSLPSPQAGPQGFPVGQPSDCGPLEVQLPPYASPTQKWTPSSSCSCCWVGPKPSYQEIIGETLSCIFCYKHYLWVFVVLWDNFRRLKSVTTIF